MTIRNNLAIGAAAVNNWDGSAFAFTVSITIPSGTETLVLLLGGSASVPSTEVLFNGAPMTLRMSSGDSDGRGVHIYDVDALTVGTFDITLRSGGAREYYFAVDALSDLNLVNRRSLAITDNAYGSNKSIDIATEIDDLVYAIFAATDQVVATSAIALANQTPIWTDQQRSSASTKIGEATTVNVGYTHNIGTNVLGAITYIGNVGGGDVTIPVITRLGISPVNLTVGDAYSDAGATALDDVDNDITANIVTVNPVNTAVAGTYIVTYNVDDAAGNSAIEVTRSVVVAAALAEAIFPVQGANVTGLTYKVFDSQNLSTANEIAAGTTAAIVSNTVTIDLAGVANVGDNVLLVLTDFTTNPSATSQASISYVTATGA